MGRLLRVLGGSGVVLALAATGLVAAGGSPQKAPDAAAEKAVAAARREVGDAYRYGGTGPDAWDCSGLTYTVWRGAGVSSIPRVSRDQHAWAWPISAADARPGDLVFFGNPVNHVALYVGENTIVDSSSSRRAVVERAVWTSGVVRYGRVPRPGVARPPAPKASPSASAKATPSASASPKAGSSTKPRPSTSATPKPSASPKPTPSTAPKPKPSSSAKPTAKPTPSAKPTPRSSASATHRPVPPAGHRAPSSPQADRLVADLTRRIGSGWEAKGSGPRYDAAGLLRAATRAAWGRDLPDTPAAIERLTRPVAIRDLRVGDLVFYGEPAVHVGIYVGNGEMIDASKVLKKVSRRRVFSSETVRFARLR